MKTSKFRWVKPIAWLVEILLIVSLTGSVISVWRKQDIVKERQAVLARTLAENARLKQQLGTVQSPIFIEREARDRLGLVKPGEIVVLLGQPDASYSGVKQSGGDGPSRWNQWWQLFF